MPNTIYDQEWDYQRQMNVSSRKCGRPLGPAAPHYPNKSEHKALVKLMKVSGKSEEEIRAVKENRQLLAKAAKEPTKVGSTDRRKLAEKRMNRRHAKRLGVEVWQLPKDDRESGRHYSWKI